MTFQYILNPKRSSIGMSIYHHACHIKGSDKLTHRNQMMLSIRSRIVDSTVYAACILMIPTVLISYYRFGVSGLLPIHYYHVFSILVLLSIAILRNRLSLNLRIRMIIPVWFFMGMFSLLTWGLSGTGILWLLSLSIWTVVVLGIRYAVGVTLASTGGIVLTGLGICSDTVRYGFNLSDYLFSAATWANAVMSFGFLAFVTIAGIWRLYSTTEKLAKKSDDHIQELRKIKLTLDQSILNHHRIEKRLSVSEAEKKAIMDGLKDTKITYIAPDMTVIWANETAAAQLGPGYEGQSCHKQIRGLDQSCPGCVAVKALETRTFCTEEVHRSDGRVYHVQANPVINTNGDIAGIVIADTDITEFKQNESELQEIRATLERRIEERTAELSEANSALENAIVEANKLATESMVRSRILAREIDKRTQIETALKESEERYRSIIESIEEGYFEVDINSNFIFFNMALCHITGFTRRELSARSGRDIVAPENRDTVFSHYSEVLNTGKTVPEFRYDIIRKDGTCVTVETSISLIRSLDGNIKGFRSIIRDVDKRRKYEDQLIFHAYHDLLTGIGNRKAFYERLEDLISQAERNQSMVALAFVDIDNFKKVNDTLGHESGDVLLKIISDRLKNLLRKTDYVFRIGGDEFTIVIPNYNQDESETIWSKVLHSLSQNYSLDNSVVDYVSGSLGVCIYPVHARDQDTLIRRADIALYRAKEKRNRYSIFSEN